MPPLAFKTRAQAGHSGRRGRTPRGDKHRLEDRRRLQVLTSSCGNEESVCDLSEVERSWLQVGVASGPWWAPWAAVVSGNRRQVISGRALSLVHLNSSLQQNHCKLSSCLLLCPTQQESQVYKDTTQGHCRWGQTLSIQ